MQPYVRDAVASDLAELARLLRAGSPDDTPVGTERGAAGERSIGSYRDALAEIDRTPGSYVLVAELGGAVAGMVHLVTYRHLRHHGGRCALVESMHVGAEHRSAGIAELLLDRAVARAIELGCHRVQLLVNPLDTTAVDFYERRGFVATHQGLRRDLP